MKSEKDDELRFGPLGQTAVHLCVDMQNLFARETDWHTPWMDRVLPNVERIARAHAAQTVFTRFIPVRNAGEARGAWRRYYERWHAITREELDPDMIELVPSLAELVPPAQLFDKISVWALDRRRPRPPAETTRGIDTLVVTGGETDVCVLATVLGAVDLGYRTVLVTDALCSSSDETHDALMTLYRNRYGYQIETVTTDVALAGWE